MPQPQPAKGGDPYFRVMDDLSAAASNIVPPKPDALSAAKQWDRASAAASPAALANAAAEAVAARLPSVETQQPDGWIADLPAVSFFVAQPLASHQRHAAPSPLPQLRVKGEPGPVPLSHPPQPPQPLVQSASASTFRHSNAAPSALIDERDGASGMPGDGGEMADLDELGDDSLETEDETLHALDDLLDDVATINAPLDHLDERASASSIGTKRAELAYGAPRPSREERNATAHGSRSWDVPSSSAPSKRFAALGASQAKRLASGQEYPVAATAPLDSIEAEGDWHVMHDADATDSELLALLEEHHAHGDAEPGAERLWTEEEDRAEEQALRDLQAITNSVDEMDATADSTLEEMLAPSRAAGGKLAEASMQTDVEMALATELGALERDLLLDVSGEQTAARHSLEDADDGDDVATGVDDETLLRAEEGGEETDEFPYVRWALEADVQLDDTLAQATAADGASPSLEDASPNFVSVSMVNRVSAGQQPHLAAATSSSQLPRGTAAATSQETEDLTGDLADAETTVATSPDDSTEFDEVGFMNALSAQEDGEPGDELRATHEVEEADEIEAAELLAELDAEISAAHSAGVEPSADTEVPASGADIDTAGSQHEDAEAYEALHELLSSSISDLSDSELSAGDEEFDLDSDTVLSSDDAQEKLETELLALADVDSEDIHEMASPKVGTDSASAVPSKSIDVSGDDESLEALELLSQVMETELIMGDISDDQDELLQERHGGDPEGDAAFKIADSAQIIADTDGVDLSSDLSKLIDEAAALRSVNDLDDQAAPDVAVDLGLTERRLLTDISTNEDYDNEDLISERFDLLQLPAAPQDDVTDDMLEEPAEPPTALDPDQSAYLEPEMLAEPIFDLDLAALEVSRCARSLGLCGAGRGGGGGGGGAVEGAVVASSRSALTYFECRPAPVSRRSPILPPLPRQSRSPPSLMSMASFANLRAAGLQLKVTVRCY